MYARIAGRLVTTGPYAVSRNPMCLAWALIHLGVGVGIGSAWTVVTLPAAVVRIDREIAREERWLAVRFGRSSLSTGPRCLATCRGRRAGRYDAGRRAQ